MLSKSDTNIADVISIFQNLNLDCCFIVPTETGMEKSILDATFQVREFLKEKNYHNFDNQHQGNDNKLIKECSFIGSSETIKSKVSLYRPNTKEGDPRIWFYSLNSYASAFNLLAIFIVDNEMYLLNCSDSNLINNLANHKVIKSFPENAKDDIFDELLEKMVQIHEMGFIKSVGIGDKAIGETLESILGIKPNASKSPDYKGIELKASRSSKNRSNLFSKTPNWKLSRLKGTKDILTERGIYSKEDTRIALYNTLKANTPNSHNMLLRIDEENDFLLQNYISASQEINDVLWLIEDLKNSLLRKHPKSFWVKADIDIRNDWQYFKYNKITYTHSPNPNFFIPLIEAKIITVDYLMHFKENGTARDHGYLFKILPENLKKLFPEPKDFDLSLLS
tara:strand:+ start:1909 stop:3090 length:1182 start_codon:yes stop_codon:yes gene_type:complete